MATRIAQLAPAKLVLEGHGHLHTEAIGEPLGALEAWNEKQRARQLRKREVSVRVCRMDVQDTCELGSPTGLTHAEVAGWEDAGRGNPSNRRARATSRSTGSCREGCAGGGARSAPGCR